MKLLTLEQYQYRNFGASLTKSFLPMDSVYETKRNYTF